MENTGDQSKSGVVYQSKNIDSGYSHCTDSPSFPDIPKPDGNEISKDIPKSSSCGSKTSVFDKAILAPIGGDCISRHNFVLDSRNQELKAEVDFLRRELLSSQQRVDALIQHLRYAQEKWIFYHKLYVKEQAMNNHPGCPDYSYLADEQE